MFDRQHALLRTQILLSCSECHTALYLHDLAFWPIWNIAGQGQVEHVCVCTRSSAGVRSQWHVTFPAAAVLMLHYSHVCYLCDWPIYNLLLTENNHFKYLRLVRHLFSMTSYAWHWPVRPLTSWLMNHLSVMNQGQGCRVTWTVSNCMHD